MLRPQLTTKCQSGADEEDEPSEAASSGKAGKEIEVLGSVFMGVVSAALRVRELEAVGLLV